MASQSRSLGLLLMTVSIAHGAESNPQGSGADLTIDADFRLRYEENSSVDGEPSWSRGVTRARVAATVRTNQWFEIGGRLTTGDPDNPRTTDVTISDLNRDFDVSLDQLYASFRKGGLHVTGGKFPKPFASTELVWDGDVNPQGLGAQFEYRFSGGFSTRISSVYFMVDDNIVGGDSQMYGAQLSTFWQTGDHWAWEVHGGYYDYDLAGFSPDSQALTRGNELAADGMSLLSDFDLIDAIASVSWSGLGDRWNIRMVGNYVVNKGAATSADSGYGIDVFAGRLERPGDVRFRYGYAETERDAVLGAFSHDNIVFATDYQLHTIAVDYQLFDGTFVGLTHYEFRRLDNTGFSPSGDSWKSRTRLNLWFEFR